LQACQAKYSPQRTQRTQRTQSDQRIERIETNAEANEQQSCPLALKLFAFSGFSVVKYSAAGHHPPAMIYLRRERDTPFQEA
jgi:hypothetical protein